MLSALGLAAADRRADAQRTVLGDDDAASTRCADEARAALGGERGDRGRLGRALPRPVARADRARRRARATLRERFEALHEERYGYRDPDGEVELVTVRVTGRAARPRASTSARRRGERRSRGPTVVALPEATLVVPEGWSGATDDTGTLRAGARA